jgi:hypothetical protein
MTNLGGEVGRAEVIGKFQGDEETGRQNDDHAEQEPRKRDAVESRVGDL